MPLLLFIVGLFVPRFVIALLWLLSSWFEGVFDTRLWPILGFLFLPLTLLWYSVVENWLQGQWNMWTLLILIIAIVCDLSPARSARK